jgi:hypothetical protein
MVAPLLGTGTLSGSLRGTQVSSVTDLMDELTRQRRVTTRLLGGLLALMACALIFGMYWTLVLRPAQTQVVATAPLSPPPAQPVRAAAALAPPSKPTELALAAPVVAPTRSPAPVAVVKLTRRAPAVGPAVVAGPTAADRPIASAVASTLVETGRLNLDTTPWSVVSVGGRVLGQTPIVGATLPVGTHTLMLSNPEQGLKATYQVTITAGHTTARRIGLD